MPQIINKRYYNGYIIIMVKYRIAGNFRGRLILLCSREIHKSLAFLQYICIHVTKIDTLKFQLKTQNLKNYQL